MDSDSVRVIVGLGNPGDVYVGTRHNVGFSTVDDIAKHAKLSWKSVTSAHAMIAEGFCDMHATKVVLVKPTTFMNASGEAVRAVLARLHVGASSMIVVCDDVNLPLGTVRVRREGGAGGHNGLKSIVGCIGTQSFARVRIGVGAPVPPMPLEAYVLQKFPKEDCAIIGRVVQTVAEHVCATKDFPETSWTVSV